MFKTLHHSSVHTHSNTDGSSLTLKHLQDQLVVEDFAKVHFSMPATGGGDRTASLLMSGPPETHEAVKLVKNVKCGHCGFLYSPSVDVKAHSHNQNTLILIFQVIKHN